MTTSRSPRWLPAALAAVLLAGTLTIIAVNVSDAAGNTPSSLTPIVPCRLADTRADQQVGTIGQPIPANASATFAVWGTNGECSIPNTATGIATNVTIVNPTASSFLTVYPADAATRPKASNLNWVAGAAPTPNQVTVGLSSNGAISVYNLAGTVDVVIDIVGYYSALPAAPVTTTPPTTVRPLPRLIQSTGNKALLFGCGNCTTDFTTVSLPKGTWLVSYGVTVVNGMGVSDLFRCWITSFLPGTTVGFTTSRVGTPGGDINHPDASSFHGEADVSVTTDQEQLYTLRCSHDHDFGAQPANLQDNAYLEFGTLSAVEVAA